jgi:hypothetical protein
VGQPDDWQAADVVTTLNDDASGDLAHGIRGDVLPDFTDVSSSDACRSRANAPTND